MTSRQIQQKHAAVIQRLLEQAGIECALSPPPSTESEVLGEETAESIEEEAQPEQLEVTEEELVAEEREKSIEEEQVMFPSASLRKIIPDDIRELKKINRLHVLPEEFNSALDPALIPKIASTPPMLYIDILAELVGCSEYKSSMAEFWFLDTLANVLRRCQADGFDRPAQAVLIQWWCEFMKEIQMFDAADRDRFLRRFKENMLAAAAFIAKEERLPTPADARVDYRSPPSEAQGGGPSTIYLSTATPLNTGKAKPQIGLESAQYQCSLKQLTCIIHYFYDLFSTDYQFELVRSIFAHTPDYVVSEMPHRLNAPRPTYRPAKLEKPKKELKKESKKEKDGKKKIPDTPEYIALMELKQREEAALLSKEQTEREEWEMKSHILPLSMAVNEQFFHRYWPPPPLGPVEEAVQKKTKKK